MKRLILIIFIFLVGCSWVRMPEPNVVEFSLRCDKYTCECQRYSVHSDSWMDESIWYNPKYYFAKDVDDFREKVCGKRAKQKR